AVPGPGGRRAGPSVAGAGRAPGTGDAADPATGRRRDGAGRTGGRTTAPADAGALDEYGPPAPGDTTGDAADDRGRAARRGRARSGRSGPERDAGRSGGRGRAGELDPDADPVVVAREICLRLLTERARTRHELAQALRRKGVPDDAAEQVLGRFDEVGLIDDAAFAGQWVRSRHHFRGLGRRAIAMELRRKGVDDEIAGEALAEVDGAAEEQRARQLVDRKLRSLTLTTPDQRVVAARRLVGMLARKGYPAGVAYGVVRAALAEHGAQEEELGGEPPDG
ncbi:MAG TPA: regulatory protein RecX, partial [Pseudonocardia sp.]|nr:regulatory protein RecX [Pseudonocardia sp.]